MFKPATSTAQLHFRTPIAVAGAALLGLSLLLTAAPAFGAANHTNNGSSNSSPGGGSGSGNVKVHDAASGVEANGTDNEPHVCAFWLEFDFADTFEAGTWFIVSWAPTGDGSTVASGTYDTAGDGTDQSSVIVLPAGHYRAEWAATGQSSTNKKTFWVDAGCGETASPVEESPTEDRAPPADESPVEESSAEVPTPPAVESPAEDSPAEDVPPSDDATPPSDDESPAEELSASSDESPAEDTAPPSDDPLPPADEQPPASGDESGSEEPAPPADEQVLAGESDAEDPAPPSDETVTEDPAPPSDEAPAPPSDEESAPEAAAPAEDPGSTDAGTPPEQDQLGGTGNTDGPTMADTSVATLPVQTGLLATIGLLLLILVHATARRELHVERE
jgi:hypothetical protein